ncbi:hypothetical protein KCU96_g15329, partial [Aureobasidium melanogenum]
LYRVELEDPKGLELVLLLSAAVIKDLYFSSDINQIFNVSDPCRLASLPTAASPSPLAANADRRKSLPRLRTSPSGAATTQRPPLAGVGTASAPDPRTQWELDAETARLRAQVEAEEREMKRQEAARRREREKADEAETRRLRKMVEEEEREARRRQEEVDRETERLRKQYRLQPLSPVNTQHRHSAPSLPIQQQAGPSRPVPVAPTYGSNGVIMSGGNPHVPPVAGPPKMKKKSFWGLRSNSDQGNSNNNKLSKKSSAVW